MKNLQSRLRSFFRPKKFPIKRLLILALGALVLLGAVQHHNLSYLSDRIQNFQKDIESYQPTTNPTQSPSSSKLDAKDVLTFKKDILSIEKDRVNAENAVYGNIVQALGGIFFFVTAYFAWRNVKTAEANLRATEEKQVTERFSKAIEHLASEKLEIRLGGIYALERIAKDSERDQWTIVEILTSFVQAKSLAELAKQEQLTAISVDAQAALTVIGRRDFYREQQNKILDLSRSSLVRANFKGANLRGIDFRSADFREAYLGEANLSGANLSRAKLNDVNPDTTNLPVREVNFADAILIDTDLSGARLSRSNFNNADLHRANLTEVSLSQANLVEAKLMEANLREADLSRANLTGAYLNNANLFGADLQGTILTKAKGLSPNQIKSAENWQKAKYDENFRRVLGLSSERPDD